MRRHPQPRFNNALLKNSVHLQLTFPLLIVSQHSYGWCPDDRVLGRGFESLCRLIFSLIVIMKIQRLV